MAMSSGMGYSGSYVPQQQPPAPVRRGVEQAPAHAPTGPLRDVTVKDVKDTINKLWIEPWKARSAHRNVLYCLGGARIACGQVRTVLYS